MNDISMVKKNEIEGWVGLLSAFGFLACLGVFAYQVYYWLKFGEWMPIPLLSLVEWVKLDFLLEFKNEWLGLQKIIFWLLNFPLSLSLVGIGYLIGFIFGYVIENVRELLKF